MSRPPPPRPKSTRPAAPRFRPTPAVVLPVPTIDEYVRALPPLHQDIADRVQAVIAQYGAELHASIKWKQPTYEWNGLVMFWTAAKAHVTVGFFNGVDLDDPGAILDGEGDRMRHLKLRRPEDVDAAQLGAWIVQAMAQNTPKPPKPAKSKAADPSPGEPDAGTP